MLISIERTSKHGNVPYQLKSMSIEIVKVAGTSIGTKIIKMYVMLESEFNEMFFSTGLAPEEGSFLCLYQY